MKLNKFVIVLFLIALVEGIYLGGRYISVYSSNDVKPHKVATATDKKISRNQTAWQGDANHIQDKATSPTTVNRVVGNRGPAKVLFEESQKMTSPFTGPVSPGKGENMKSDQTNSQADLSQLNLLVKQMTPDNTDVVQQVMNIADQTTDNGVLHKSLQGLGRLGTDDANHFLVKVIGRNLDNPVEVTRILSYLGRSAPLERETIDLLAQYLDSPSTSKNARQSIVRKIRQSGGQYGRDLLEQLR